MSLSASQFTRGGQILLTLYSVDTEKPAILKPWTFPGFVIDVNIIDSYGNLYTFNLIQPQNLTYLKNAIYHKTKYDPWPVGNVYLVGFLSDNYSIIVTTCGYTQRQPISVHVVQGGNSDVSVWMVQDPRIDLTLVFKTEGLLAPIDSTLPFAYPINHLTATPVRVEIFDMLGNFVGANVTYIPNNATRGAPTYSTNITLAGFNQYAGDPSLIWAGFYDTTDAYGQNDGGLQPGAYQIRVWVDGYCQLQLIPVTLPSTGKVSMIYSMERASRVRGTVMGPESDQYPELLSWAVIDLEPGGGNFTTYSLDGNYSLWVPAGSYNMGVYLPGYALYTARMEVPKGSDIRADIWLDNPRSVTPHASSTLSPAAIWLVLPTFTGLTQSLPEHAISEEDENDFASHHCQYSS